MLAQETSAIGPSIVRTISPKEIIAAERANW
jgi:hypothetical protein